MSWEFERIAGPYNSPVDGPTWDGEGLLFTQLVFPFNAANNRILRYHPQSGEITDFRQWTNRTVRLTFDGQGVLYGCQSTGRRLVRFNQEGSTSAMSHLIGGVFHNMPQDLVADRRGRLWFCDPHGDLMQAMNPQIHDKLDHASVLRLENPNDEDSLITRMTLDTDAPQALLLSQDEKTLYVAETSDDPKGDRELRAYPILADDTLGLPVLLHRFGSDAQGVHRGISGMTLDRAGNVVACAGSNGGGPGPMVYVFSPAGRVLESHPLPEEPTNCAFGGFEKGTLYVTTRPGNLFKCSNTTRRGWSLFPPEV